MIYTYSPSDVVVYVGAFQITGFSENSIVSIKPESPAFRSFKAADGMVSRAASSDSTFLIELVLSQGSTSNDVLNWMHRLDRNTKTAKLPLFIKDTSGTSFFFSPSAWISTLPDSTFGRELSDRVWVFEAPQGYFNIGGNRDDEGAEILSAIGEAYPIIGQLGLI